MRSLSISVSVFVMVGFSGKPVQIMLLLNFVSKNCKILILTKTKYIGIIRNVNKKLMNNSF